ncbi:MAG: CGNR zinc finger domain-containing protein [Candidatus Dormibacteria bacterium]|jgi:predicted RNA-binding Zn ribbon-like protein
MDTPTPAKQPAPGPLGEVQAFVNSRDEEAGRDDLAGTDSATTWLRGRDVPLGGPISETERQHLVDVREALREVLATHDGHAADPGAGRHLDRLLVDVPLHPRVSAEGVTLVPGGRGVDAYLATLAIAIIEATIVGTWQRLKVCRLTTCRWAFYDHTKNAGGAWCSMRACGSRAKARAYRARRVAAPTGS